MCMTRSKQGIKYVRLCAWYIDSFGPPIYAVRVNTGAAYRQSWYVYYTTPEAPTVQHKGEGHPHFDPSKKRN